MSQIQVRSSLQIKYVSTKSFLNHNNCTDDIDLISTDRLIQSAYSVNLMKNTLIFIEVCETIFPLQQEKVRMHTCWIYPLQIITYERPSHASNLCKYEKDLSKTAYVTKLTIIKWYTASYASDHLCQIWREPAQNCHNRECMGVGSGDYIWTTEL